MKNKLIQKMVFIAALFITHMAGAQDASTRTPKFTPEQKAVADFWDDNPFTTVYSGHFQYAIKKISPAGHWLHITKEAITLSGSNANEAAMAYAVVSSAMADAFICCWREKYSSNTMRPETYINKYIDEQWKPYLQSPPFPEYTSGHSTVSASAATILTYIFGENFTFTDTSETDFNIPERTFNSFYAAAEEASS